MSKSRSFYQNWNFHSAENLSENWTAVSVQTHLTYHVGVLVPGVLKELNVSESESISVFIWKVGQISA
jgi:hypothetical protein